MSKIERRRVVVTLYQGNYEAEIAALMNEVMTAERAEEVSPRRMSSKSPVMVLAQKHDQLLAEAEETAVKVPLWAVSYTEWGPIADLHPPREDESSDQANGVNLVTFPGDLLLASFVAPGEAKDVPQLLVRGADALAELGDLSHLHYKKLERAAWDVNVGDDALPKYSLVSLLKQQRGADSKPQNDSE